MINYNYISSRHFKSLRHLYVCCNVRVAHVASAILGSPFSDEWPNPNPNPYRNPNPWPYPNPNPIDAILTRQFSSPRVTVMPMVMHIA